MQILRLLLLASLTVLSATGFGAPLTGQMARVGVTDSDIEDIRRWRELRQWMDEAIKQGAAGLILDINVTQSHAQAALSLAEEVARLKIKTKAYVNISAIGGGALLALACDEIWMAPGSRIGAAPPKVKTGEELSQKAQDTLLAESLAVLKAGARSLCKLKGHRPEIADAFVDRDKGLVLGTLKLADKGELLLLDADTAVQAVDGKPLLARAIISDVEALAKAAEPKGKLVILNGVWYDQTLKKAVAAKPVPEVESKSKNKEVPAFTSSQSYAGKVVVIPVGQDDLILPARFELLHGGIVGLPVALARGLQHAFHGLGQRGQVFGHQLLLQCHRSGGDQHPRLALQCQCNSRGRIGGRLAHAGAGLDDGDGFGGGGVFTQVGAGQRGGHTGGHLVLAQAGPKAGCGAHYVFKSRQRQVGQSVRAQTIPSRRVRATAQYRGRTRRSAEYTGETCWRWTRLCRSSQGPAIGINA